MVNFHLIELSDEERKDKLAILLSKGTENRYNQYRYSRLYYNGKWYQAKQLIDEFDRGYVEGEMRCDFCHHLSVVTVEHECWAYEMCGWRYWEGELTIQLCLYCFEIINEST